MSAFRGLKKKLDREQQRSLISPIVGMGDIKSIGLKCLLQKKLGQNEACDS